MSHNDLYIDWLNNAHAMEVDLAQVLEGQLKQLQDVPEAQEKIAEHLKQTKRHADLMRRCIENNGGSVSSVKSIMGSAMGIVKNASVALADDKAAKIAVADYASEHLEIATYNALIAAAEFMHDEETVRICEEILEEEEDMAEWLLDQIPTMAENSLGEKAADMDEDELDEAEEKSNEATT